VSPRSKKESAEAALEEALLDGFKRAGREAGYRGYYYLRSIRTHGALAAAKRILAKRGAGGETKGFRALLHAGRPDLSVEAIILRPEFRSLFTPAELATARERLKAFPNDAHRRPVPVADLFPEVLPSARYREGGAKRVTINAYERNQRAREACIRHHGTRCVVCRLRFENKYGKIGRGFIHVHHIKPLALRQEEYRLDPKKDLVPVCPNCHAMLHTSNPPLSVDELRRLLRPSSRKTSSQ
jgi:5-methylcytosine-specific restriction protein A